MINKYFCLGLFAIVINVKAQNCTPQATENNVGDNGCVSLTYQNQNVSYKTVRAADGNEWLQQNLGSSNVAPALLTKAHVAITFNTDVGMTDIN